MLMECASIFTAHHVCTVIGITSCLHQIAHTIFTKSETRLIFREKRLYVFNVLLYVPLFFLPPPPSFLPMYLNTGQFDTTLIAE